MAPGAEGRDGPAGSIRFSLACFKGRGLKRRVVCLLTSYIHTFGNEKKILPRINTKLEAQRFWFG